MLLLIWVIVVLFGVAAILDQVMSERQMQVWRDSTRDMRKKIYDLDAQEAIARTHGVFCDVFDLVYGNQYWSRRRFVRSCYSSILAVGITAALLGWQNTVFGRVDDTKMVIGVIVGIFILNGCADYLSLQETRWVLGYSKSPYLRKLSGMILVDLLATCGIWLISFFAVGSLFSSISGDRFEFEFSFIYGAIFEIDRGLMFFLSTFLTSALWLVYILSVMGIWVLKRNWRLAGLMLDAVGESEAPAKTSAGIISILLSLTYGIFVGVVWVARSIT